MNEKQCREMRKAIVEKFPQFKNYNKSSKDPKDREIYAKFKRVCKEAKKQFNNTSRNKRQIITVV